MSDGLAGVHAWQQRGCVCLWRYLDSMRKDGGWHLSADRTGALSLLELVSALQRCELAATRTVQLTAPDRKTLGVPSRGFRWWAPEKWRISTVEGARWRFAQTEKIAALSLGGKYLSELADGLRKIAGGDGDYCIGDEKRLDEVLWFWWQV